MDLSGRLQRLQAVPDPGWSPAPARPDETWAALLRLAGLDPVQFSGHSLRAGLATPAAKAGKSERAIMRQTGHRSAAMVRRYIRDADLFNDNAAAGLL